jgi:hypothetical protein
MRHRSRPPLRPAPTPQPSPAQMLSGEVSAVPRAPVAPGRQLPPALSDSARDAVVAKLDIICAHAAAGFSAKNPTATIHHAFPTPLGLSHARAGRWGRCGTALARGHPNRGRSLRRRPSADSSNRSLRTQTDRCRGRRTSCGRPLVPQAQRAPQSRRSKPLHPSPGLLPGLAADRIAEAAVASTTEGRSDGGLTSGTSRVGRRGVLTHTQGKPFKPSYAANRLAGPLKCSSARKTRCSPRCHNGSADLRRSSSH